MMVSCHAGMAVLCDLGAPGWGEPWFPRRTVLLISPPWYGFLFVIVFSLGFLIYAIPSRMIQCYRLDT